MADTATVTYVECIECAHRSPTLAVNVVTGVCEHCTKVAANQRTTT